MFWKRIVYLWNHYLLIHKLCPILWKKIVGPRKLVEWSLVIVIKIFIYPKNCSKFLFLLLHQFSKIIYPYWPKTSRFFVCINLRETLSFTFSMKNQKSYKSYSIMTFTNNAQMCIRKSALHWKLNWFHNDQYIVSYILWGGNRIFEISMLLNCKCKTKLGQSLSNNQWSNHYHGQLNIDAANAASQYIVKRESERTKILNFLLV